MSAKPNDGIFIVSQNIDRYHAYRATKRGKEPGDDSMSGALERICQGVYMNKGADPEEIFTRFGLRIANYLMRSASLSYATAWHRAPVMGRVFVTGQYQYIRPMFGVSDRYMIVQSIGEVQPDNPLLHTLETFKDKMGKFQMLCDTPELTLLNMMTATKRHSEKHLSQNDQNDLTDLLLKKHKSKANAISALERIAETANRENELRRVVTMMYSSQKTLSAG